MRYLSLFSGIEAATVAWHPLGWTPLAFSEIEPFPCEVLKHHYPSVRNMGDVSKFKEWPDFGTVDLIVGGAPCQAFSVAGLRAGLADPRGNLTLTYLAVIDRYRPKWVLFENVPGILSSTSDDAPDPSPPPDPVDMGLDGQKVVIDEQHDAEETHAFSAFLAGLRELGYGFAYRVLDAQYVRVDGFPHAVPQRRRRVFVVGYLGDWRRAAAVFFDAASLRGDPAPRREAGKGTATDVVSSLTASGRGVERTGETRHQDPVIAVQAVAPTLNAAFGSKLGLENQHIDSGAGLFVAGTLGQRTTDHPNGMKSESDFLVPVAWSIMPQNSGKDYKARAVDVAQPLMAGGPVGGNQGGDYIQQAWAVRRLTPTECERLQGFPDGYTDIPRAKSKAAADGPRYKALGNSMAVNAMRWIGERIAMVDALHASQRAAA